MGITNDIKLIANQIVQKLDELDSKDNKISADTWKKHAVGKWGAKDNVNYHINIFKAAKSIEQYLKKEHRKSGESISDIGDKWYNDLITLSQTKNSLDTEETATAPNKQTGTERAQTKIPEIKQKEDVAQAVSTNVAKLTQPDIIDITNRDLANSFKEVSGQNDIDKYVKLAKMTSTSSAKANNDIINDNLLNLAFDNVINDLMRKGGKKRSVLIGTASHFADAARKNNVDLFTLMGISMIESSYGTSKMALNKNNVGGLTPNGRDGIHCQTVSDSINIAAKTLHNNVYNKGLDTIKSVGMKGNYCCAEQKTRAVWVKNVTFFANKVKTEYNRLLEQAQNA